ncbi:MAG: hypothetical protein RLZ91_275 [Bacteroidota bacterium]
MDYNFLKSLHIIFVVSWFAGLFYLPRLLVYHVEAQDKDAQAKEILSKQFEKMEKLFLLMVLFKSIMIHTVGVLLLFQMLLMKSI